MTDEEVEKIIKRNMSLQMNLAGIRADFEEASQRTWVGLTDEEIDKTSETQVWDARRSYARAIEAKLKELNT